MRTSFICSSKGVGALEGAREEKAVEEFSFAALRKAWSGSSVEMKLSSMLLIDWVSLEMIMFTSKTLITFGRTGQLRILDGRNYCVRSWSLNTQMLEIVIGNFQACLVPPDCCSVHLKSLGLMEMPRFFVEPDIVVL